MSRRTMMAGGLALAGAAIGGFCSWRRIAAPSAGDIERLVYRRLSHLNLDPAGVSAFAREYTTRYGALSMSVHYRETFGGVLARDAVLRLLPEDRRQRVITFERRMISYYLRSTDYFRPGRDPNRIVRYVAFPDPYELPCTNPFAVLVP